VYYVDDDATGANDGSSWSDAFTYLQDALNVAAAGDEIRVAQGVYQPDRSISFRFGRSGERETAFDLRDGVAMRGGYAGLGAPDPDARDIGAYESILSGDLQGDDAKLAGLEWQSLYAFAASQTRGENSYTVVIASGVDGTAVLDGFTITAGSGKEQSDYPIPYRTYYPGGMYCYNASPTVINCTFRHNTSVPLGSGDAFGGGLSNNNSSPTLRNCSFIENIVFGGNATACGGGIANSNSDPNVRECLFSNNVVMGFGECWGGGMCNFGSDPKVTDCSFVANSAIGSVGGAMFNYNSSHPILTGCTFEENLADEGGGIGNGNGSGPILVKCVFRRNKALNHGSGGGMANSSFCEPALTDCTLVENSAAGDGGGIYGAGSPTLTNCKFYGNSAVNGGAIHIGFQSDPVLVNCLFSGNRAEANGGAVYISSARPKVINCTFSGNRAQAMGGGIYSHSYKSEGMIVNSILWLDTPQEIYANDSAPVVVYSDVKGGWLGGGNTDIDPVFANSAGPDGLVGTEDDDLRVSIGSPCIDAGQNSFVQVLVDTDLDGNRRIVNGVVDMGAYEYPGLMYVDDDAPADPGPGDPDISDPCENGTEAHPFDAIQEAMGAAGNGYRIIVLPGHYLRPDSGESVGFFGKNLTLTSTEPTDPEVVDNTVIRGYVQFGGTEGPDCGLLGFSIRDLRYGAIYGNHTQATISHCVISGNGPCGATVIKDCDGTISNCLITDNITVAVCGVYPVVFGCNGLIKNCTIANNVSGVSVGTATIENCIIANNAGAQLGVDNGGTVYVSYSDVEGGLQGVSGLGGVNWGPGNIDADPCFVSLGQWKDDPLELVEGDYHLKSEGWRWSGEPVGGSRWTWDDATSPCIDTGNPGSPLHEEPLSVPRDPNNRWAVNLRINMGVYGGTRQAGMAPPHYPLLADLNNDGRVNALDLALQAEGWLVSAEEQPGDLSRDGKVDMDDFAALAREWRRERNQVESVEFREYWPFAVGNKWESVVVPDWAFTMEITDRFNVNGFEIWEFTNHYVTFGGPLTAVYYYVYVDGILYSTENRADIDLLPEVSERLEAQYREVVRLGVPADIPSGNATAFQGTLESVLENTRLSVDDLPLGDQDDVLGFVTRVRGASMPGESNWVVAVFARGLGPMYLLGLPIKEAAVE
jgi:hypothetical protein